MPRLLNLMAAASVALLLPQVAPVYVGRLDPSLTFRLSPTCHWQRRAWTGFLGDLRTPPATSPASRACFARRGGYLLGAPAVTFVVMKEWPR